MHITEPPAGLVALDSDSAAIVVIDRARRILFKNRSAEALLTAGAALTEHHQTLATLRRTDGGDRPNALQVVNWRGRDVTQISLRAKRWEPAHDTASTALRMVAHWFQTT